VNLTVSTGATHDNVEGKIVDATGPLLLIATDTQKIAILKATVTRVVAAEMVYSTEATERSTALKVTCEPGQNGKVYILALERGLTWTPAYHVDISNDKELLLTAKSTVLNDLAPLKNTELRFITGFPNIAQIGVMDPLTSRQTIDQFISSLMNPRYDTGGGMGQIMAQNASFAYNRADTGGVFAPYDPSNVPGVQSEDLFFFKQPNVTLDKGERAYFVLFQAKCPYEHIFTLNADEAGPNPRGYAPSRGERIATPTLDVWHTLCFTNKATSPLTTAPATTVKDGEILGQDTMGYTPSGTEGYLRVTKALDIRAEAVEEEISREAGFIKDAYRQRMDRVTVKGTIELVSNKATDVKMKITKTVSGEVTDISDGGKSIKTSQGLGSPNPSSNMSWTITLKKGAKVQIKYTYKTLIPS